MKITKTMMSLIVIATLLMSACTTTTTQPDNPDIKYFTNAQDLRAFLEEQQISQGGYGGYAMRDNIMAFTESSGVMRDGAAPPSMAFDADFSTTNVQVEGIDEADIVKTDGETLYILSGRTLTIIDTSRTNPQDANILLEQTIRGMPQSMFLANNELIIFTNVYEEEMYWPEHSIVPVPRSRTNTQALIYDISTPEDPRLIDTIRITGSYSQARLLDNKVYLVTQESPYYGGPIPMPRITSDSTTLMPRVGHIGVYETNPQYTTITSFTSRGDNLAGETYLTGYGNTVYMSYEALYIAHQKSVPWRSNQREQFFEVVVPELPGTLRSKIRGIDARNIDDERKWDLISQELTSYMNGLLEQEQETLYERIQEAVARNEREQALERSRTIIHKFSLDLRHVAQTELAGNLLNQFSLDEHDNNLRVATSVQAWTAGERIQHSNVYVLDERLRTLGSIEDIAPDERIFSTRFIGNRLYMVTFEEIDPFFVIDLSDPRRPEILGELKIPGWSDYLHPYDKDHIIGLGRQTSLSDGGRLRIEGVKLSLFNVADVNNPREVATYEIGGSGSHSEALYDHKAFLFDRERELLVLPVVEMTNSYRYSWDGAYVFRVTTDGFEQQARIAHRDSTQDWWSRTSSVRRALYIDETLYTISKEQVRLHDLKRLDPITSIRLNPDEPNNYYWGQPGRPMQREFVTTDAVQG